MGGIKELKRIAEENGCALFGTSDVSEHLPNALKHLPYAITLGMRYPKTIIAGIKNGPTSHYFHHYRTMNANLDRTAVLIEAKLLSLGNEAVYIPASQSLPDNAFSGLFSHKIAAVKAGLGFIGKNNLFIHDAFGPSVRLATVLTDYVLPTTNTEMPSTRICEACNLCAEACPAGAILNVLPKEPYHTHDVFNAEKCSYTMKNKYKHIGRGAVCGICIAVCPYAKI